MQFTDQGRLADSRVARDRYQRRLTAGCHAIECGQQRRYFLLAPIELVRDLKALRKILRPQWERGDTPARLPLRQTPIEIELHAAHALVSIFRQLGQQFHRDVRYRLRHLRRDFARWPRDARNMAMRPFQGIVRGKRQLASQHPVKRDAEGIEIGTVIDHAIHAPGLLGRYIGQVARACGQSIGRKSLILKGGDAEIGQENLMTFQLDQKVGRPDILVNDLGRMHVRQDMCQSAGDVQAGRKIHAQATIKNGFERLACEVVQDHRQAPVFINQGCRFRNPHDIK